jgi:hypothetical protein
MSFLPELVPNKFKIKLFKIEVPDSPSKPNSSMAGAV